MSSQLKYQFVRLVRLLEKVMEEGPRQLCLGVFSCRRDDGQNGGITYEGT